MRIYQVSAHRLSYPENAGNLFLFVVRDLQTTNKSPKFDAMMRPQDIVILLKVAISKDKSWQYRDLAADLYIPLSEISAALKRSETAGLYNAKVRSVHRLAFVEFIQYGLKYVFPTRPGAMVAGLGTAHSQSYYKKFFQAEIQYVWPDENGDLRGLKIAPLHPNVPKAARKDELLYMLLASIDVLRVGKVRESKMAIEVIKKTLL